MGFRGGYRFRNFDGAAEAVLRDCPVPETVFVTASCGTHAFEPVVGAGDPVRAGTRIMTTGGGSPVYLHSPVNGTVTDADGSGVRIHSSGTAHFDPVEGHTRAPWLLDRRKALELFRTSGCAMLVDADLATVEACDAVRHIAVNAVHNGPLDQAFDPSLSGDPFVVPSGLKTLKALFPNAVIVIAANKRAARYFRSSDIAESASVKILSDKYPQESPELVARDALGVRLTAPDGTVDSSALLIPFFDVVQIAEVMSLGRPLIDRVILAAGPGISRPGWYRVRIGTPLSDIRRSLMKSDDRGPWRIIRDGLFEGTAVDGDTGSDADSVVDTMFIHPRERSLTVIREAMERELYRFMRPGFRWDSYSITTAADVLPILTKTLDSGVHGGTRPCVQCNFCDDVCPVGIYPFLIWKHVVADRTAESFRLRPYDCIGCGLCDYVCPSKIEISKAVKEARDAYRSSGRSNEAAD